MNAIEDVVGRLRPAVEQLLDYLQYTGDPAAIAYFESVRQRLQNVTREEDLLDLFMFLSTMAFQGFTLDPVAATMADQMLAYAEQVSHAFSADDKLAH